MSWATYKAAIETVLDGYTEIPENNFPDNSSMAHNHKAYSLQQIGIGTPKLSTASGFSYTHSIRLRVKYTNIDSASRDDNVVLFLALVEGLTGLVQFDNFISEPKFEDLDNKHTQGIIEFYYGYEGC